MNKIVEDASEELKQVALENAKKSLEEYEERNPIPDSLPDPVKDDMRSVFKEEYVTHFIEGFNYARENPGIK